MELLIGVFVVTYWVCAVPRAVVDVVATWRASKAGAFDFISRERDRRDARRQARRERWDTAWRALRARRNREAGGTGHYRPGLRAYLRDVYDGFWMRQLERRRARRAHTMPSRPVASPLVERMYQQWDGFQVRLDDAVAAKVQQLRHRRNTQQHPQQHPRQSTTTTSFSPSRWGDDNSDTPRSIDEPESPSPAPGAKICPECGQPMLGPTRGGDSPWLIIQCRTCGYVLVYHNQFRKRQVNPDSGSTEKQKQNNTDEKAQPSAATTTEPTSTTTEPSQEGDKPMVTTAATGDVVDVETCAAEVDNLIRDFQTVAQKLEEAAEVARTLQGALDSIQGWMSAKNFSTQTLGGVGTAIDALDPHGFVTLIGKAEDAVGALQNVKRDLAVLQELSDALGGVAGSALNGR